MKNTQTRLYKDILTDKDIAIARKLAVILSMAENLDFTETNAVKDIFPDLLSDGRALLGIAIDEAHHIELDELRGDLEWVRKEFKSEIAIRRTLGL
jgi:exopolyphosphatase/guanosine-5'-triphosphate,3'-diphosphate pyrophosphatase